MRSLLRKELRSLLPFIGLVVFFGSLDIVFTLLAQFPDQVPLSERFDDANREAANAWIFIMAIALSAGLLVREQDEGTLSFLDGLPVSRARIFVAKFLPGLGVLLLLPVFDVVTTIVLHALGRTSLERGFPWQPMGATFLIECAQTFTWFAVGLALSFLRKFSYLVLAVLFWGFALLAEARVPWIQLINVFALGDPVYAGRHWLLPVDKLAVQLPIAIVLIAISFAGFLASGERTQRLLDAARPGRFQRWLAGIGAFLVVAAWVGFLVYKTWHEPDTRSTVSVPHWRVARASTARYRFVIPGGQSSRAEPLIAQADTIEERVRGFLGAEPLGPIQVDLTAGLSRHAGLAYWKRVRMDLGESSNPRVQASILAHETTHVMLDHHSDGRLTDDFNSTRFFHEGVASYVEYHLFLDEPALRPLRRLAAVARSRGGMKLEDLTDDGRFAAKHDRDLVYPLGEVFTAALVQRYGTNAPGNVAKAFGRKDAPRELKGLARWQDTLQSCGYNWSAVADAYNAELDRAVAEHRAFIDSLPRLRGAIERDGGRIGVRVTHEGEAPGRIVCRFRPRDDTADRFYETGLSTDGRTYWVDGSAFPEATFWFQPGWVVSTAAQPIYEDWVEGRRPGR